MSININNFFQNEKRKKEQSIQQISQWAEVIEIDLQGNPIIVMAGEALPNRVTPKMLKNGYVPEIGDLVQIIDGIIQGGVK